MAKEKQAPQAEEPERVRNHKLTRYGMECVIRSGGAVQHNGKTITKVADLPSDAELASTDAEKAQAETDIDAQIARLQAQKAKLAKPAKAEESKPEDVEPDKGHKPAKK